MAKCVTIWHSHVFQHFSIWRSNLSQHTLSMKWSSAAASLVLVASESQCYSSRGRGYRTASLKLISRWVEIFQSEDFLRFPDVFKSKIWKHCGDCERWPLWHDLPFRTKSTRGCDEPPKLARDEDCLAFEAKCLQAQLQASFHWAIHPEICIRWC